MKKNKKPNLPRVLREPSHTRQMAQKILTHSQLAQSAPPGIKRTIIGSCIKEEDKKPKIELVEKHENEFYQNEIRKLQQNKQKQRNKNKWPSDAKLVHIDGSQCSDECMKTSRYHLEPTEMQQASSLQPIEDPRNIRPMGMTLTDKQNAPPNTGSTLTVMGSTTETNLTSDKEISEPPGNSPIQNSEELGTTSVMSNEQTELPLQDTEHFCALCQGVDRVP